MKTKFNLALFLTCLFLITQASRCKPDKKEWKTYGPFYLGELADYVCFKTGTVWIYKNPANNLRDTVKVAYSYQRMDTIIDFKYSTTMFRETFYTGFSFSSTGYYGRYNDFRFIYQGRGEIGYRHRLTFVKVGEFFASNIDALFYPFDKSRNDPVYPGLEALLLINKDTSVLMNGRNFPIVQVFKNIRDHIWGGSQTLYFWAPNFGIIYRKNLQTNEEWYLESETIIQ